MEQIFTISQPWTINGIWSDGGNTYNPAVLFLSAGLLRSHGPNRLYVESARKFAAQGISSLRFDLSGVGDSVERSSNASIEEKTFAEMQEVMNAIAAQKGITRFILVGLCSGAHDAIDIALRDDRVVSVVSIDGYFVKSRWYKLFWFKNFVLQRILQKKTWLKQLNRLMGKNDAYSSIVADDDLFFEDEPPEKVIARFSALLHRKVPLLCLFTGGVIGDYSYHGQLADAIPQFAGNQYLTEAYCPEMDHLLLLNEDREKVVRLVSEHIVSLR